MWSSPDIDDLREWQFEEAGSELSSDTGGWSQAVGVETRGDPWTQKAGGSLLHSIDEIDEEDPGDENQ